MTERIQKTIEFLKKEFSEGENLKDDEVQLHYRTEHSFRVAALGEWLAEQEGLDAEAMAIGGLLHDISYKDPINSEEDWKNHGRNAARIARPFLETLGLKKEILEQICYGIAIHVDDEADFAGEKTVLALSIGDCDNLDRFDAYRIYETLEEQGYRRMPLEDKKNWLQKRLEGLKRAMKTPMATQSAGLLWQDRIQYQINFLRKLREQAEMSTGERL